VTGHGYRVEINRETCISSGRCVGDAPGAFVFDDDELATVGDAVSELAETKLLRIARDCPGEAIIVYGADGVPLQLH
jgi:ferredoxin